MKLQKYLLHQSNSNFLRKLFFTISPFRLFVIKEESMIPTLFPSERILVNRMSSIKKGDIIIVKYHIDDKNIDYLVKRVATFSKDMVYVRGDNISKSIDSRKLGWISKKNIVGKMIAKL